MDEEITDGRTAYLRGTGPDAAAVAVRGRRLAAVLNQSCWLRRKLGLEAGGGGASAGSDDY